MFGGLVMFSHLQHLKLTGLQQTVTNTQNTVQHSTDSNQLSCEWFAAMSTGRFQQDTGWDVHSDNDNIKEI